MFAHRSPKLCSVVTWMTVFTLWTSVALADEAFTEASPAAEKSNSPEPTPPEEAPQTEAPEEASQPAPLVELAKPTKRATPSPKPTSAKAPAKVAAQKKRSPWFIGFGFGNGPAQIRMGSQSQEIKNVLCRSITQQTNQSCDRNKMGGLSFYLEIGKTLNPQLLVGAHLIGRTEFSEVPNGTEEATLYSISHQSVMATITWFPIMKGVFFRGGLGPAAVAETRQKTESAGSEVNEVQTPGFGMMVGVGYAFWLGKRFNLLISSDLHGAVLMGDESADEPTESWFNATQLGFMWY